MAGKEICLRCEKAEGKREYGGLCGPCRLETLESYRMAFMLFPKEEHGRVLDYYLRKNGVLGDIFWLFVIGFPISIVIQVSLSAGRINSALFFIIIFSVLSVFTYVRCKEKLKTIEEIIEYVKKMHDAGS